jgi:riboflavin synthase
MFTGLIEDIGQLVSIEMRSGDARFEIKTGNLSLEEIQLGDSIAINGVCLTVSNIQDGLLAFDVSIETLKTSALNQLRPGSHVNLEQALKASDRLGGHLVSGHVDGIAELIYVTQEARSWRLSYKAPKELMKFIAKKGSVCLDGVSLTVNDVSESSFNVNIIPHTRNKTIIQNYITGQKVNLEVDVLARYIERMLGFEKHEKNEKSSDLSYEKLVSAGF